MTSYKFQDTFIITGFELGFLHRLSKDYEMAKEIVENVLKRPYEVEKNVTQEIQNKLGKD